MGAGGGGGLRGGLGAGRERVRICIKSNLPLSPFGWGRGLKNQSLVLEFLKSDEIFKNFCNYPRTTNQPGGHHSDQSGSSGTES